MGTLRLTPAQWTGLQALVDDIPKVRRIYRRVNLGEPAGIDATGAPSDTPAFWIFDDPRLGGLWRVRIGAGNSIHFQEWDALVGGTMQRELTLAEMQAELGSA